MGRERFQEALAGRATAFAPLAWRQVPRLVRQPTEGWWREGRRGQRLLDDVAALADADALFVCAAEEAVTALEASGRRGDDALDELAATAEARDGNELIACLVQASPYAVIAALPTVADLADRLGSSDLEAAEDALSDLARGALEAGADALAVRGADLEAIRAAVEHAAGMGGYYGRPTLGICATADRLEAWVEGRPEVGVVALTDADDWPALAAGVVVTAEDVSVAWEASRLHVAARRRAAADGLGQEASG